LRPDGLEQPLRLGLRLLRLGLWLLRLGLRLEQPLRLGLWLCAQEREACAHGRLLPSQYLNMKVALLRENERRGYITRAEARNYFRLDPLRTLRVYDLMVANGWINPQPPPELQAAVPGGHAVTSCVALARMEYSNAGRVRSPRLCDAGPSLDALNPFSCE
jgi:hypothetical protein